MFTVPFFFFIFNPEITIRYFARQRSVDDDDDDDDEQNGGGCVVRGGRGEERAGREPKSATPHSAGRERAARTQWLRALGRRKSLRERGRGHRAGNRNVADVGQGSARRVPWCRHIAKANPE